MSSEYERKMAAARAMPTAAPQTVPLTADNLPRAIAASEKAKLIDVLIAHTDMLRDMVGKYSPSVVGALFGQVLADFFNDHEIAHIQVTLLDQPDTPAQATLPSSQARITPTQAADDPPATPVVYEQDEFDTFEANLNPSPAAGFTQTPTPQARPANLLRGIEGTPLFGATNVRTTRSGGVKREHDGSVGGSKFKRTKDRK